MVQFDDIEHIQIRKNVDPKNDLTEDLLLKDQEKKYF